jgi:putative Mg2+ transporter-C (MgtC) family protein
MFNWDFMIRLLVASLLGSAIGIEREYRAKEAGYRTHFLVALGSALFMLVSQYGFAAVLTVTPHASFDPSRIASQVVTGIGFIGAGIIFQKHIVRGLTTAAGLWVTSAIGLAVGAGMYALGITVTVLALLCLEVFSMVFTKIGLRSVAIVFTVKDMNIVKSVSEELRRGECIVVSYSMETRQTPAGERYQITMVVKAKKRNYEGQLLGLLHKLDDVTVDLIE